jgi:hypothetical protein
MPQYVLLLYAERLPTARYGPVEVRPIMDVSEIPVPGQAVPGPWAAGPAALSCLLPPRKIPAPRRAFG